MGTVLEIWSFFSPALAPYNKFLLPAPSIKAWLPAPGSSFQRLLPTPAPYKFSYPIQRPLKRFSFRLRLSHNARECIKEIIWDWKGHNLSQYDIIYSIEKKQYQNSTKMTYRKQEES